MFLNAVPGKRFDVSCCHLIPIPAVTFSSADGVIITQLTYPNLTEIRACYICMQAGGEGGEGGLKGKPEQKEKIAVGGRNWGGGGGGGKEGKETQLNCNALA